MASSSNPPASSVGDDPLIGAAVGKYEILRKLGHGGMGRVYEALNPTIGKRVALKLLDPRFASDASVAARFTREAQSASAASSPHIVEIFDAGVAEDGSPFIVMELLEGEALSSRLEREGKLAPDEAARILIQVLRGLVKAHEAGIVHRDLKPDNIFLVDREHEPPFSKILDFGISKVERSHSNTTLTREGTVLGTPAYMSPEQAQGATDVDARSDVWSLGAIFYECLSGRRPFDGSTYEQVIVRICTEAPAPLSEIAPEVPADLAEVVEACMRRDRDERIASAWELLDRLGGTERASSESGAVARASFGIARSSLGTDSTIEASGVLMDDDEAASSPTSRHAVVIGIGLLVACVALVVWSRTRADERPELSDTPAAPLTTTAEEQEQPVARETTHDETAAATAEALPSASASASASATATAAPTSPPPKAKAPTIRPRPRPRPPPPAPPAAPPPPKPRGVAGQLEIQPD